VLIWYRSPNLKHEIQIIMNDINVEQVKSTFLGIIIDECLTWNDHIRLNKLMLQKTIEGVRNNS
jgi:hypothetical protein